MPSPKQREDNNRPKARPFLRWAGSKQKHLSKLLPYVPENFSHYYEPFLGSGALFFAINPSFATLSDKSDELINTWLSVRNHVAFLCEYLGPLKPSKELYYKIRGNRASDHPERAGEFLYLNRTCWNGLYRVNSRGDFNVPYGAPKSDFIFDRENLVECSRVLSQPNISLCSGDFSSNISDAQSGDFVFLDPPYVTKHNNNGFRDWNETLFRWDDQVRLAKLANQLADRGVHVMVSNANNDNIAELYGNFSRLSFERSSTLASDAEKRGRVSESVFYTS